MSRRTSLALIPAVALLCAGCGTMDNVKRPAIAPPTNPDAKVCRAYGGVRGDWEVISEYPWGRAETPLDYVVVPLLAGGDLFFTALGDTLTLPYTLVEEGRRAFARPASQANFSPTLVPEDVSGASATPAAPATPRAAGAPARTTGAALSYFATPN
jgi:uncharacterized protein YceK